MKVPLSSFLQEVSDKTTINDQYPVLTSSKAGLFLQSDYFNKQVASRENIGYKIIRRGQFTYRAMSDTGEFFPNMLECADIGIVSPAYPVFEITKPDLVLSDYLKFFFKSDVFQHSISAFAQGSTRTSVKFAKMQTVMISLPSIDEQRKIVEALKSVQKLVTTRETTLSTYDELIKARFVEMFGDPETNPMGWQQVTLSDVCSSIVRGPFGSALKKDYFVEPDETTYKVYEQKHAIQKSAIIGTYYVTEEKFKELKRFECVAGDIIMSCSGTMGELYQLPEGCERGIINQALCKFTLNNKILPVCFLVYMRQTIKNLETKGSGIQNIAAVSYVKNMPINLPPMEIQKQFASFVSQVDKSKLIVLHLFPFPAGLHQMTCIICPEIFIPNRRISLNHFFIRLYTSFSKRFVDNT